jgi:hypothetical protein
MAADTNTHTHTHTHTHTYLGAVGRIFLKGKLSTVIAEKVSQDLDSYIAEILLENSAGHLKEMNHLWSAKRRFALFLRQRSIHSVPHPHPSGGVQAPAGPKEGG